MPATTLTPRRLNGATWRVALFALPLAISGIAMNGESPIVNAGVSRLGAPERGLAAFGVAVSVAWLIESPIVMLLDAVTARAADQRSFAVIRRYALLWCAALTAVAGVVAFTAAGAVFLRAVLGVEADVAHDAQRALRILLLWPAAIAWRRLHQGVLIRLGQTRVIGYVVGLRLTTSSSVVLAGVLHGGVAGATLGACALACGVTVESTTIWLCARRAIAARLPAIAADAGGVRDLRAFHRYYLPLAGTMLCFMLSSTLLTAGLARGASPSLSLAVWPVAYSLVLLLTSPLNGMQQVAVRLGVVADSARETRRLLLGCGAAVSALLVALNASGGTRWLFDVAINSPASTHAPALRVAWLLSALPLLVAARALCRGVLIAHGRTAAIQLAILLNVATLAAGVLVVGPALSAPAYLVAAVALLGSTAVETAFLARGVLVAAPRPAGELAVA